MLINRLFTAMVVTAAMVATTPAHSLAFTAQSPPASERAQQGSYVLGYGDSLNLKFVGNDDMAVLAQPIRPDGYISVPLLGDVLASGLTVAELTTRLNTAYKKFIANPQVVLNVAMFRPLQITVLGMVKNPGTYQVPKAVTLLQALGLANGTDKDRANMDRVLVVHQDGTQMAVNGRALLQGELRYNVLLSDGDTVTVEESAWPDVYRLLPVVASILGLVSTILIVTKSNN